MLIQQKQIAEKAGRSTGGLDQAELFAPFSGSGQCGAAELAVNNRVVFLLVFPGSGFLLYNMVAETVCFAIQFQKFHRFFGEYLARALSQVGKMAVFAENCR